MPAAHRTGNHVLAGPQHFLLEYRTTSRPNKRETIRRAGQSYEFNVEQGLAIVGSPETVIRRFEEGRRIGL